MRPSAIPLGPVLVTGGAGYIGSVVVRTLLGLGHEVIVIDDLSTGHADTLPPTVRFVQGSIGDPEALAEAFDVGDPVAAIVHLAAHAYVGESMESPAKYFLNNTASTIRLCVKAQEAGVSRFVLSSSCTVYGVPEAVPITEEHPTAPISPYGTTKRQCEEVLRWFGHAYGLRWAALRYFNAAGAVGDVGERHDPETHLIPLALLAARGEGPPLRVFGGHYPTRDGTAERDYVHVADLARAHALALDALLETPEPIVVNLGSGKGSTVLEVLASIERVTGRAVPHTIVEARAGDPAVLVASHAKASAELGWRPERSTLDEIVADASDFMDRQAARRRGSTGRSDLPAGGTAG
jgi:UDP-glucose-4-epimerase GalE